MHGVTKRGLQATLCHYSCRPHFVKQKSSTRVVSCMTHDVASSPATNSETARCQEQKNMLASKMTPRSDSLAGTNDDGVRKTTNAEAQRFLWLTTVATTQVR